MNTVTLKIEGSGSGVYLLKSKGVVVYVGMSTHVPSRLVGHKRKHYDEVEIRWMPKKEISACERSLIRELKPILNLPKKNSVTPETRIVGKGYSCLPETHAEIESRRIALGLKSGGKVLETTFKPKKPWQK